MRLLLQLFNINASMLSITCVRACFSIQLASVSLEFKNISLYEVGAKQNFQKMRCLADRSNK